MIVYLIGFMGSGKARYGKRLAEEMQFNFVDTDILIEQKEKLEITEIFKTKGEDYFRKIERKSLLEAVEFNDVVISAGGGTPCFFDNMQIMNNSGLTIYIRQGANCLYHRLNRSKKFRPLVQNMTHFQLIEYLETILEKRKPFYEQAKYNILGKNLRTQQLVSIVKKESKSF